MGEDVPIFWSAALVGGLIVPNTANVQMGVTLIEYHLFQKRILTTEQINGFLIHMGVSTILVIAMILLILPEHFIENQKRKFLCCNKRMLLFSGLLFGNFVGLFPMVYTVMLAASDVPFEFVKSLAIASFLSSSTFSSILVLFYHRVPQITDDNNNNDEDVVGKVLLEL